MPVRVRIHGTSLARTAGLDPREARRLLERAARTVLRQHGAADAEVSIALLDDAGIAGLNRRWLGHEGPTDVLSFPLWGEGETPVGDVYIGWEQAVRQAAELGVPPEEELVRLAAHGTLHVLGYDHPEGPEREEGEMWTRQEAAVREVMRR